MRLLPAPPTDEDVAIWLRNRRRWSAHLIFDYMRADRRDDTIMRVGVMNPTWPWFFFHDAEGRPTTQRVDLRGMHRRTYSLHRIQ